MKKLFLPSLVIFIISQVVMFYLAVARLSGVSGGQYLSGSSAHFLALFFTSFLIVFTLKQIKFEFPYVFVVLYSVCAAVAIEFIQLSIPYRTFSFEDMFFGILGSITFILLSKIAKPVHRHIKKHIERHLRKMEE